MSARHGPGTVSRGKARGRAAAVQLPLFRERGGRRRGAGRKALLRADGKRAHTSHAPRPKVVPSRPLHVTVEVEPGLPSLRGARLAPAVLAALAAGNRRSNFRVVHFSVQSSHVHLVCEADGNAALARGMRGVNGRIAKAVNRTLRRRGRVVRDRYHLHVLRTKREVRYAVQYVLRNGERHGVWDPWARAVVAPVPDPLSSAAWFPGWAERELALHPLQASATLVAAPRSWLLRRTFDGAPLTFATRFGASGSPRRGAGAAARQSASRQCGAVPRRLCAPNQAEVRPGAAAPPSVEGRGSG